jgi:hypothetical protein
MVGLKNTAQNARYMRGIFDNKVKHSDQHLCVLLMVEQVHLLAFGNRVTGGSNCLK